MLALEEGDHETAALFLGAAIRTRTNHVGREDIATELTLLAENTAAAGNTRRAADLLGAAAAIRTDAGDGSNH